MRRLLFHSLAWLTDRALSESMLGDLEELRARAATRSSAAAALVFWRAAIGVVLYALGTRIADACRALGRSAPGRGAGGDLRQALRTLRRHPAFATAAILLLTLGIGANTLVFSVVRGVMLRPLPYERPEEVVFLWGSTQIGPGHEHNIMTGQLVREIAEHQTRFDSVAAFESWETGSLQAAIDVDVDGAERLRGAHVTPNFFELLGVHAAAGRTFTSGDTEAAPVAVISHALWQRLFGGDRAAIGASISIAVGRQARARTPFTILGVLPPEFRLTYPQETEVYLLKPWSTIRADRALLYGMVGRLREGVAVRQAEAELTALAHNVVRGYGFPPDVLEQELERRAIMAEPARDHVVAEVRPGLQVLTGVAGLVLLIACVNIGLLLLSRTIDRSSELAVRAALGAGPWRIARQLLAEGLVLALTGGVAGVFFARAALPLVRSLLPAGVPRVDEISIDGNVLLFALGATVVTGLVCGLTPGVVAMRRDLLAAVRRAGGTSTADRRLSALRGAIVGLQVAVVIVLLVGAGLLLHSFWRLQNVTLGFDADDVLTFETRLLNPKYREAGRTAAFGQALLEHVRQLPGVQHAALSTAVPMRGVDFIWNIAPGKGRRGWGYVRTVDPSYFDIMRIPLRTGRLLSETDGPGAPPVIVISESYARAHFGEVDPLGRRLFAGSREFEIIGVVGDVRYASVDRDAARAVYVPRMQNPAELICLLVKPAPGMKAEVASALREAVAAIDPEQPIEGLTTIGDLVAASTADQRFYAWSTAAFATVALLLAVTGVFGVLARSVAERRREIAIRMALGAHGSQVMRMVIASVLLPVVLGCLAGLLAAQAASKSLEALLFEITAADPVAFGAAAALVLLVALTACLGPALRASRMAPMAALKND